MTEFRKYLLTSLFLILVGMAYSSTAKADPLHFSNVVALQNNGSTSVDLFSNPGVTLFGPQVSFLVDVSGTLPPGGFDQLSITFTEAGGPPMSFTFDIPFGDIAPPLSFLFTYTSLGANFQGMPVVMTLDLLNSSNDFVIPGGQGVNSYSYTFNVAQPVPEPASLTLASIGLAGLIARARKRRKTGRPTN